MALMAGIKNEPIPNRLIKDPEIRKAFDTPIESAINPVCSNPIMAGSSVMLP